MIRSSGNIAPGDHLSICYTDPLWGRRARICHLIETKFFLCRCPRCSDPTEIGTHFNSVRCTKYDSIGAVNVTLSIIMMLNSQNTTSYTHPRNMYINHPWFVTSPAKRNDLLLIFFISKIKEVILLVSPNM